MDDTGLEPVTPCTSNISVVVFIKSNIDFS
nr:MAG TPA: hypothetical protein [Caudoviricetes sp.]